VISKTINQLLNRVTNGLSSTQLVRSSVNAGARIQKKTIIVDSKIGANSYVGPECRLFSVDLGSYSSLGPRVIAGENEHEHQHFTTSDILLSCLERYEYERSKKKTTLIEPDVWIGAGAFLRKGVTIHVGSIIGAHAVVLEDIPPYSIAVGVPARVISTRFPKNIQEDLIATRWWEREKDELNRIIRETYTDPRLTLKTKEEQLQIVLDALGNSKA